MIFLRYFSRHINLIFVLLCRLSFVLECSCQPACDPTKCTAPNCHCPGMNIPGGFHPEEIPQMVLLAFDDAVNWDNWAYYSRLFPPDGSRKNPNGCPITMTLFVSHNYTDYCMVRKLHGRGIEIADHSLTHQVPHNWWSNATKEELSIEILTQRHNLAKLAEIPLDEIRGWRSPFLQPTGDTMFQILWENNFTYDATLTHPFPRNLYSPVLWPFTLDYPLSIGCNIQPCPRGSYPGLWEIPVVTLMDYREHLPCAYVDFCQNKPRNKADAFQILWKNFLRNYRTNRAPYYLNLHSPWLDQPNNLAAMDEFLLRLVDMDDVYIITVHQAIKWLRSPTPSQQLNGFVPWQCPKFRPNVEDTIFCHMTYRPKTTNPIHATSTPRMENSFRRNNRLNSKTNFKDGVYPPGFFQEEEKTRENKKRKPWFLRNAARIASLSFWSYISLIVCWLIILSNLVLL